MKYYYEPPYYWEVTKANNANFNHPLYNKATLYLDDKIGIAVVQHRFNEKTKMMWWGPIDPWLIDEVTIQEGWDDWFHKNAQEPDKDGLYPTFTIREVMWAMRMKPLMRNAGEGKIKWRNKDVQKT